VVSESPAAVFVLLTEDTSSRADDTLRLVTRHLLRVVRESLRTHRLRFEPAEDGQRPMLAANRWKSAVGRDEPKVRDLCQWIATKLSRSEGGAPRFVLFHYDGDRIWSQRKPCDNAEKFEERIRAGVRQALFDPPQRLSLQRKGAPAVRPAITKSPEDIELFLRRLIEVVPFYSMEAWLFRNVEVAKTHCLKHCGGAHIPLLEAWQQGEPSLDEVSQPKEKLCFRDQANVELAGPGFPAADLYLAETSFYETAERLRQSPHLVEALKQTEQG
jgi:hypothetical protein